MSLEAVWGRRLFGWRAACWRGESIIERMVIDLNEAQVRTLEQVQQVLAGTQSLEFRAAEDDEGLLPGRVAPVNDRNLMQSVSS